MDHPIVSGEKRRQAIRSCSVFLLAAALVMLCVFVKAWVEGKYDSVASLQTYIGQYGVFGPLVLTVFQALQVVIPVLPGFLGCGVGSVLFGPAMGFSLIH